MTNEAPSTVSSVLSAEQLYNLYATDVLRFAYYYLGDRQKAEDVTQDVFVKFITTHPALSPGREKAWLLKVTLNRCRDHWRSSWVRRIVLGHPSFESFPSPEMIDNISDQVSLAEAVNHLPPEFKEVVLLFYYQNFSVSEIADLLSVAEGTVSSRLNRARSRIKSHLEGGKQK